MLILRPWGSFDLTVLYNYQNVLHTRIIHNDSDTMFKCGLSSKHVVVNRIKPMIKIYTLKLE